MDQVRKAVKDMYVLPLDKIANRPKINWSILFIQTPNIYNNNFFTLKWQFRGIDLGFNITDNDRMPLN